MTPGDRSVPAWERRGAGPAAAVVDASIGLKWVLPEPGAEAAIRLIGDLRAAGTAVYVPDLFWLETANALWRLSRGAEAPLSAEEAVESFEVLRETSLRTEPAGPLAARALEIAMAADVTTYDAAYIALAELLRAWLWTADAALLRKLAGTEWGARAALIGDSG